MRDVGKEQGLRVLDVGSGTGDGLALFASVRPDESAACGGDLLARYLGIDCSPQMVATARELHGTAPNVSFQMGDVRESIPGDPFDIYFSSGVPYSHLTENDLETCLYQIFHAIRRNRNQAAIVIDVLGRYSIEWVRHWEDRRWQYRMSFFVSDQQVDHTPMTVYGASDLQAVILGAARSADIRIRGIEYLDRSILVGRHSATLEFNPGIPPYRTLVNALARADGSVAFQDMLFNPESLPGPSHVRCFFGSFAKCWNTLVAEAADAAGDPIGVPAAALPAEVTGLGADIARRLDETGSRHRRAVAQFFLERYLRRLGQCMQPGLGVGHTLIAVTAADGAGRFADSFVPPIGASSACF
ncbi:MAG TPA: class I SAM-dependent methyltransferase [Arenibaculum sp.]|nr:class I SAM-dependent methyltransferase [Arenibaculum sp.]